MKSADLDWENCGFSLNLWIFESKFMDFIRIHRFTVDFMKLAYDV